jgi:lantibiotic biosynthesis protein
MTWRPVLMGAEAERARAVALEVASRLATAQHVPLERSAAGLGSADASIALVCGEVDRLLPDRGWDRAGHVRLSGAARVAERDGAPLGLFDGIAGLGFAAQRLAAGRTRYGATLTAIDDAIAGGVAASRTMLAWTNGLPVRAWDLISGITGIGAYLLGRGAPPTPRAALEETLAALVDLMRETDGAPRWATPPEHLPKDMLEGAPEGNLNCGVAHGAPGSLALMSLALTEGVEVDGQLDAIRRLADWVAAQRRPGRLGPEWPAALPLGEMSYADQQLPARPGWCYGNAGVARALWLAGNALDDPPLAQLAERALQAGLDLQRTEQPLHEATLCHGTAGLAQVAIRMAADSGAEDLSREARMLCLELVERFDPEAPFGYRAEGRLRDLREAEVDATLLDGAAGPALVLLAAATDMDPGWDRALLLS